MTRPRASLREVLGDKRLIVLVGEGGVGKTSVSAAIGFALARRGASVGVLTVDPAPRLGDALGIAALESEPKTVALPADATGSLTAMRLDTKRTFDRMVELHSTSAATTQKLLVHPIYRAVSDQLGGTENYMAFQRLHELVEQGGRDCLVVDTPPAANATELLSAPARLTGLLDTGALSVLTQPARIVARGGGMFARATVALVLAAIGRVTGSPLQKQVGEFVGLFTDLLGGLEDRARRIDALLREPDTAFVLVTRPRENDVNDALAFRDGLSSMGIGVAAIIVNRVTPAPPASGAPAAERLVPLPKRLHRAVLRMEADMQAMRRLEQEALARLRSGLSGTDEPPVFLLAARDVDVATLEDVAELAAAMDS